MSKRRAVLREYEKALEKRLKDRQLRDAAELVDETQDHIDAIVEEQYKELSSKRYLFRGGRYRKSNHAAVMSILSYYEPDDLNTTGDSSVLSSGSGKSLPWLNETEFLNEFRMSPMDFWRIVDLIKDDRIFRRMGKRKQAPVALQLAVLLRFLGTNGEGGSNPKLRNFFHVGRGTISLYKRRAATAIRRQLRSSAIKWPNEEERRHISERMAREYNFPNCIGLVDGTLFPLFFRPTTEDFSDYSGRKYAFSLNCMVICDDQRRVIAYLAGWPGSCHDDRILKKMKLYNLPLLHFDKKQYLLGDSAFENCWFIVSAFKKPAGGEMAHEHERFNTLIKALHHFGALYWLVERMIPLAA